MKKQNEVAEVSAIPEKTKELIIGWNNSNEVAESINSLSHRILLYGNLLFAFKNSELQVVISRYSDGYFGISQACPGYTALVPHITKDYIETCVIPDLEKIKINKDYLEFLKRNLS